MINFNKFQQVSINFQVTTLKVKNKSITKNSGLTLIEVLVAMGIFSMVISVAIGIFVSGSNSQRRILGINTAQREAGYLMETISRELRMAKAINATQENNDDTDIEFTNYNGNNVKYCKSNQNGDCMPNQKYLTRVETILGTDHKGVLSSSDIEIKELTFYSTDDFDGPPAKQPVITIVMKVKSKDGSEVEFTLQNSVSLRLY